jgi:hypothetical protein
MVQACSKGRSQGPAAGMSTTGDANSVYSSAASSAQIQHVNSATPYPRPYCVLHALVRLRGEGLEKDALA